MRFPLLILFPATLLAGESELSGEQLFTMHCSACHLPDQQVVGPSLVEIHALYRNNLEGFLDWTKNPRKKREGLVEMPSMAHLPDDGIEAIHAHIMKAAEGLEEREVDGKEDLKHSQTVVQRPNLLRIPMPDAGPASIAVAVDDNYSYCWDAGICRLRYVWKGGFIDAFEFWSGNGKGTARVIGRQLITEKSGPLSNLAGADRPEFLGYSMKDRIPTFRYRLGKTLVTERIEPGKAGLERRFTLDPAADEPLELVIGERRGASWTSSAGRLANGVLVLQPEETAEFTLSLMEP